MSSSMSVYVYVTSLSAGDLPCDVQHVVSWSELLKNTHPDRHTDVLFWEMYYMKRWEMGCWHCSTKAVKRSSTTAQIHKSA